MGFALSAHFFAKCFSIAATSPGMVFSFAAMSTCRPCFFKVWEVMGPMLAIFVFCGSGSFNARKCSQV